MENPEELEEFCEKLESVKHLRSILDELHKNNETMAQATLNKESKLKETASALDDVNMTLATVRSELDTLQERLAVLGRVKLPTSPTFFFNVGLGLDTGKLIGTSEISNHAVG